MAKGRKWSNVFGGVVLSLAVYLGGVLLLAVVLTKGWMRENSTMPMLWLWAAMSSWCGSIIACKCKAVNRLLAALLQSVCFVLVMLAGSYLFWSGPVLGTDGIVMMLSAAGGGLLPGMMKGKGGRRLKRR